MILYSFFNGDKACFFRTIAEAREAARIHMEEDLQPGDSFTLDQVTVAPLSKRTIINILNGKNFIIAREEVEKWTKRYEAEP